MNEIIMVILHNLGYVGSIVSLIFIFQLSNMLFGLCNSICVKKEVFDREKIKCWIIKTILTLLGIAVLTTGTSLLPYVVTYAGISIPEAYGDVITVLVILVTALQTVLTEATKAFDNYKAIMDKK